MSDPVLRVVRGTPDDAELAALTAAVVSLSVPHSEPRPARRSEWSNRRDQVRTPLPHGPNAWRASALPSP